MVSGFGGGGRAALAEDEAGEGDAEDGEGVQADQQASEEADGADEFAERGATTVAEALEASEDAWEDGAEGEENHRDDAVARGMTPPELVAAPGGAAEEESFEIQVKARLASGDSVTRALASDDIAVIRRVHYHQYDTYFFFADPEQGRLRYREDEFLDAQNQVVNARARLTLTGPSRVGSFGSVLLLAGPSSQVSPWSSTPSPQVASAQLVRHAPGSVSLFAAPASQLSRGRAGSPHRDVLQGVGSPQKCGGLRLGQCQVVGDVGAHGPRRRPALEQLHVLPQAPQVA